MTFIHAFLLTSIQRRRSLFILLILCFLMHSPGFAVPGTADSLSLAPTVGRQEAGTKTQPASPQSETQNESAALSPDQLGFQEVWGYLMEGEERFFSQELPISDIGYFSASINSQGKLVGVPSRSKIRNCGRRVHLVIADLDNYALVHFCFSPEFHVRDALISDIVLAAQDYEGVQLDFEAVATADKDNYLQFARLLKSSLGGKTLSIALPAATRESEDHFGYKRFAAAADRIVIMAYDEHWSTSRPGPVASMEWCSRVADYAVSQIPPQKLIMGAPFYGRAWADKSLSRAYRFSSLSTLIDEKGIDDSDVQRLNGVPYLEYSETVKVRVYFDDALSTAGRLGIYRGKNVWNIAFWRLGQEDANIWKYLSIEHEIWPSVNSSGLSSHMPCMMR